MSVLDKNISYFTSTSDTRKGVSVNLLSLLHSQKHEALINALRAEPNPEIQCQLKEKLPCYTVAGFFKRRCEVGLINPSGLAAVDLDSAEDYDVIHLLNELKKIPFIAYAGLSCRGKRLFAIIPLLYPCQYTRQYERLIRSFEDIGLPMGDTCHKSISQPRYVSYNSDDTCFFNHNAKSYHLLPPEKTYHHTLPQNINSSTNSQGIPDDPFSWCETQVQKGNSFADGNRHKYIITLSRYCNIKGISESDTLSGCLNSYHSDDFPEQEIIKIVKHVYSKQSESHNKLPFKHSEKYKDQLKPFHKSTLEPDPTSTSEKIERVTNHLLPLLNKESTYSLSSQPGAIQDHLPEKPLHPASGRLKELENTFIRITQHSKNKPTNRGQIIRFFDQYKRVYPVNCALDELDFLIQN